MLFFKLFVYILCAYGLSEMVVFGRGPFGVFEKWREIAHNIGDGFGELFTCMLCFPTWVGMTLSFIDIVFIPFTQFTPFNMVFGLFPGGFWLNLFTVLLDGFATAGICWLLYQVEEALERVGDDKYGENEV